MQFQRLDAPSFVHLYAPDFAQDPRGRLMTPIPDADLAAGRVFHVHPVTCAPGAIRGNHFHPRRTETACVVAGTFLVRLLEVASGEPYELQVTAEAPRLFVMRAGVAHAFQNVGPDLGILLCWADEPYDPADIHPAPLI